MYLKLGTRTIIKKFHRLFNKYRVYRMKLSFRRSYNVCRITTVMPFLCFHFLCALVLTNEKLSLTSRYMVNFYSTELFGQGEIVDTVWLDKSIFPWFEQTIRSDTINPPWNEQYSSSETLDTTRLDLSVRALLTFPWLDSTGQLRAFPRLDSTIQLRVSLDWIRRFSSVFPLDSSKQFGRVLSTFPGLNSLVAKRSYSTQPICLRATDLHSTRFDSSVA